MNCMKKTFFSKFQRTLKLWILKFKKERMLFGLSILAVRLNKKYNIELDVLVSGIKNQIIQYSPEEIVFNDELLTEFSPFDIRAITYLSFQKHIKLATEPTLLIKSQHVRKGKTIFVFFNRCSNEEFEKGAIAAYQDYEILNEISKKDMLNVVSTAVQEQSFQDFSNMG